MAAQAEFPDSAVEILLDTHDADLRSLPGMAELLDALNDLVGRRLVAGGYEESRVGRLQANAADLAIQRQQLEEVL